MRLNATIQTIYNASFGEGTIFGVPNIHNVLVFHF